MNYKLYLSLFLLAFSYTFSQTNLIHNAGFETNIASEPNSPCKSSQVGNMQVWEDDAQFVADDIVTHSACSYLPCSNEDCAKCYEAHSPDWYKADYGVTTAFNNSHAVTTYTFFTSQQIESNVISAHNGEGYIGMFPGELIEQNFFNSSPIVGGKKYTFSMYVRLLAPDNKLQDKNPFSIVDIGDEFPDDFTVYDQNSTFNISIFLSTQKIKYKVLPYTCTTVFKHDVNNDFKDLTFNNITKIKDISLSPLNEKYGQWHKISFEFQCPSNHNYDWIAIEQSLNSKSSGNNGYILIDDVSLIESCELGCYPTSGIPNPIMGTPTTGYNVPLQISNLGNVEKARIEIFPLTGQTAIYDMSYQWTNGITTNLYWDGWGWNSQAASGIYICRLTCENECGSFTFSQNFFHGGSLAPYPPNVQQYKFQERQIYPCCLDNYTISNATLNSTHYYKPRNNIYVNTNVTFANNSNTSLVAGNQIEILSETGTLPSAELSVYIEDCADSHRFIPNPVLTDKDFTFYENTSANLNDTKEVSTITNLKNSKDAVSATDFDDPNFTLRPNPNSGEFLYYIFKPINGSLSITNTVGIEIYRKQIAETENQNNINISDYKPGIYYLYYKNNEGKLINVKKISKQ